MVTLSRLRWSILTADRINKFFFFFRIVVKDLLIVTASQFSSDIGIMATIFTSPHSWNDNFFVGHGPNHSTYGFGCQIP
jgi:hypothetical protein